jgi:hypothetical protein
MYKGQKFNGNLFNFINKLSVNYSKEKGFGIFAETDLLNTELLIVEKPIATVFIDKKEEGKDCKSSYKRYFYGTDLSQIDSGCKQLSDACLKLAEMKGI